MCENSIELTAALCIVDTVAVGAQRQHVHRVSKKVAHYI